MTATEIRTMRPADRDATVDLLLQIPQGEHMFVKHSVADAHTAGAWLDTLPPDHYVVASVEGGPSRAWPRSPPGRVVRRTSASSC